MTDRQKQQKSAPSAMAAKTAARLAAVQAVYQVMTNDQSAKSVIEEYRLHRFGQVVDGADMTMPDGVLFQSIVNGVYDRMNELEFFISNVTGKPVAERPKEPLLHAIMLCGAYELHAHLESDAPIIINDYLDVTHAFYEQGESRLVNGVLDKLARALRDMA